MGIRTFLARPGDFATIQIPRTFGSHPHEVDVYRPKSFDRAIILLHGGAGKKEQMAFSVGILNSETAPSGPTDINWDIINYTRSLILIPTGQRCTGTTNAFNPNGVTSIARMWSNWDAWSQYDDPTFLRDMADYIKNTYGLDYNKITLSGHSMGAFMTMRMFFEYPGGFGAFCSSAGAANHYFVNNMPATAYQRPLMMVIGDLDDNIDDNVGTNYFNDIWVGTKYSGTFWREFPPTRIGNFKLMKDIAAIRNMSFPTPENFTPFQGLTTSKHWRSDDSKLQLYLVNGATHNQMTIQEKLQRNWLHMVNDFARGML
jgi:pimeloyl-ACP methyl ester carboxylesterase